MNDILFIGVKLQFVDVLQHPRIGVGNAIAELHFVLRMLKFVVK